MFKKVFIIYLAIILLMFPFGTVALAEQEPVFAESSKSTDDGYGARYTYIDSTSASLSINTISKASCSATIAAYPGVDSVRISAYLQYYDEGWHTVKSWAESYSGTYGAMAKEWYVSRGYQYRFLVYYYAYSGSNSESTSKIVYRDYT